VGDAERQVEFKRVEEVVASGSIEHDLRRAMKVVYSLYIVGVPPDPCARNAKTLASLLPFSSVTGHWT